MSDQNEVSQSSQTAEAPSAEPAMARLEPHEACPEPAGSDEALHRAVEQLRSAAEELARCVRSEAAERLRRLGGHSVSSLVDTVLDFVREHPGPGAALAVAVGFLLGRALRK